MCKRLLHSKQQNIFSCSEFDSDYWNCGNISTTTIMLPILWTLLITTAQIRFCQSKPSMEEAVARLEKYENEIKVFSWFYDAEKQGILHPVNLLRLDPTVSCDNCKHWVTIQCTTTNYGSNEYFWYSLSAVPLFFCCKQFPNCNWWLTL